MMDYGRSVCPDEVYIEGKSKPALPGDVPHLLMGPPNMINDLTDRIQSALGGKYDPDRGDEFIIHVRVKLVRGNDKGGF